MTTATGQHAEAGSPRDAIAARSTLPREQRRRYARLRRYALSRDELIVWLLRVHERMSFAEIGALIGATEANVREIDRSMTSRALVTNSRRGAAPMRE